MLCPIKILKTLFPLKLTNSSLLAKYSILLKKMNLWTDSERKWALESESKPEIEQNICFIKICPIKILKTPFPLEANKLFSCGQSIQFY